MDQIQHKFIDVARGLKLHLAEIGCGHNPIQSIMFTQPSLLFFFSVHVRLVWFFFSFSGPHVVVFLHGFPEIWYTWRHQMMAVANAGFRAIAPDYRGYGLSDPPPDPAKASFTDLLTDLLGILDALQLPKVLFCYLQQNIVYDNYGSFEYRLFC